MQKRWHFYLPPFAMDIEKCYKIGYILKPHGLKGGVTVSLDAETPADLHVIESVFLQQAHHMVPYFVESISLKGNKAFVKFEDVDTPEAAEEISKQSIYLPKADRPKSGRGDFYDDEISGFTVEDKTAGPLGLVEEVMAAGANKLLVVRQDDKEVLIPVNSPFIISINKSRKRITVDLPEGFLDI